jgi:putative ABC transport system permease protein
MFRNYLKVAMRNLSKRKGYSIINILGLAIGMAVCLLIVLFIQSELSYDGWQAKADNIYRVVLERRYPGRSTSYSFIPQSIGGAIQKEYPEVIECTRLFNFGGNGNFFLRIGDKVFEERRVIAADSNFFRVFTGRLIAGDSSTALVKPNSVVLNETTAKKYFGSASAAMGKTFVTDDGNDNDVSYLITGVCADWPDNSHFLFDLLISTSSFDFTKEPNYTGFAAHTYLLLNPNASPEALEAKFPNIIKKYVAGEIGRNFGQSFEQFQAEGNGYHYYLQPLKQVHLTSHLEGELRPNGSITAVYIFAVVAVFILFLACINFINLSTARSMERAREVGIRKTFGSNRKSLVWQFLLESIVISVVSMLAAFCLIVLLLPLFNKVSGKELAFVSFLTPAKIALLILFSITVGLIAGLYPAFVLSSFKPTTVLKGKFKSNKYGMALRNSLVVFQFAISVILIVCTIVVNKQMRFMLNEALGFNKDHVIVVERADLLGEQTRAFENELGKIPGVETVSGATALPGQQNFFGVSFQQEGSKESLTGRGIVVDDQYAKLLGLEIKEGRFFSKDYSTDSLSLVLNEKAVEELGLKKPIGARLTSPDGNFNAPDGSPYIYTVVGVIKDFHFQSLHEVVSPLIFANVSKFRNQSPVVGVRVKTDNFQQALASIENTWKKFVQQRSFHYSFLDQTLAAQYSAEQTTQKVFTIFSVLAIFIACIGLLGLAAYTTQMRNREISIRKVLGASVGSIITMLSKDFMKLVLLAALIAFPVAWLGMHKWLEDFSYRINISGWIFLTAALSALAVALLTISFQAIKAAVTNPVKNLRTE